MSPNLHPILSPIWTLWRFSALTFKPDWPPEQAFTGPAGTAGQADQSWITYLTSDPQALGILSWVSFWVTTIGLIVAVWQILKVRDAADAAQKAATDMGKTVRSREMLLQMNSGISYLEHARNHVSKDSRDAASLCLDLSITALIGAKELAEQEEEQRTLQKAILSLRVALETVEGMSAPLPDDNAYLPTIKKMRASGESVKQLSLRSRYAYSTQDAQS